MKVALSYHDYLLAMQKIHMARNMRRWGRRLARIGQPNAAYTMFSDADVCALSARRIWDRIEWVEV